MTRVRLEQDEITPFDVFFASIASMATHPGTTRDKAPERTMQWCADKALEMVLIRREVLST